jgi:hypothetical protein
MNSAKEPIMKKLIVILIACSLPGIAGCNIAGGTGARPTTPNPLPSKSKLWVKPISAVDAKDEAMSIGKSARNPSGVSETESHFSLYTARFGTESNAKQPAISNCDEAPVPMDSAATLSRRTATKKQGC